MVNTQKTSNTFFFLFSNKVLVIRAEIHKMLVGVANREDPEIVHSQFRLLLKKQSELAMHYLSMFVYALLAGNCVLNV